MDLIVTIVIFITIFGFAVILAVVFLVHKFRTSPHPQDRPKLTPKVPSHRKFVVQHGKMVPAAGFRTASIRTPSIRSHWSIVRGDPSWTWSRIFLPRGDGISSQDLESNRNSSTPHDLGIDPDWRHSVLATVPEKPSESVIVAETPINPTPPLLSAEIYSKRTSTATSFHTCPSRPNLISIPGGSSSTSPEIPALETPNSHVFPRPSYLSPLRSKFHIRQEESNWRPRSPLVSSPPILASNFVIPGIAVEEYEVERSPNSLPER